MRILDSANQLLEDGAGNGDDFVCGYCGADTLPCEQHSPDCPWFSMPRIVAVLEAAQRLLPLVQVAQCGHTPKTIPMGPHKRSEDPDTIEVCSACDERWPCVVARTDVAADALWRVLDPVAYRENELYSRYLGYIHELDDERPPHLDDRQRTGESRTEWFTRLLTSVGRMPDEQALVAAMEG